MNSLEISTTGIIKAYVLIYGLSRYFCLDEWAVNQDISVQGMWTGEVLELYGEATVCCLLYVLLKG